MKKRFHPIIRSLFIESSLACIALILLYVQFYYVQSLVFGLGAGMLYVGVLTHWWRGILWQRFGFRKKSTLTVVLAAYAAFLFVSLLGAICTTWYTLSTMLAWGVLAFGMSGTWYIRYILKKTKQTTTGERIGIKHKPSLFRIFPKSWLLITIYGASIIMAGGLLAIGTSTEVLVNPWQSIHPYYIMLFVLATVILGFIILSKHSVQTILCCIVLHSCLLHAYIPLSHTLPWGGDVWRNIAVEQRMKDGDVLPPVLVGEQAKWKEVVGVDVPEAFIIPHKYAYGQLWSSVILISHITTLPLEVIHRWLVPLLWSVLMPLLFFLLGKWLFTSQRTALLFGATTILPFTFQAMGGITVAVSMGYIAFFFILCLWIQSMSHESTDQKKIIIVFAVLFLWSYTLHAVILWWTMGCTLIYERVRRGTSINKNQKAYTCYIYGTYVLSLLIIPCIELVTRKTYIPSSISVESIAVSVKQYLGQLTGWYYASAIRPHDILSGNIIFNHLPQSAFVESWFTNMRWQILVGMSIILLISAVGFIKTIQSRSTYRTYITILVSCIAIGGYSIGWFFLTGDRVFTRRLDGFVAFICFIFFIYGLQVIRPYIMKYVGQSISKKILLAICSIVAMSVMVGSTYASGPDLRVLSKNEQDVARYIWDTIDKQQVHQCILADTWVLLSLEAASSGKIVGGGFPINEQFGQPERVRLLQSILTDPNEDTIATAHRVTQAPFCIVTVPKESVTQEQQKQIEQIMGGSTKEIGPWYLWKEQLKQQEE